MMKKIILGVVFVGMLVGAIHVGVPISTGTSVVYAGGTAPMDTRVDRP